MPVRRSKYDGRRMANGHLGFLLLRDIYVIAAGRPLFELIFNFAIFLPPIFRFIQLN